MARGLQVRPCMGVAAVSLAHGTHRRAVMARVAKRHRALWGRPVPLLARHRVLALERARGRVQHDKNRSLPVLHDQRDAPDEPRSRLLRTATYPSWLCLAV